MTEPSVEEIVALAEGYMAAVGKADSCWLAGADIRALIADWRKRGEALAELERQAIAKDPRIIVIDPNGPKP